MDSEQICEYCGPECLGGAAHNARVEDGAKLSAVEAAAPLHMERRDKTDEWDKRQAAAPPDKMKCPQCGATLLDHTNTIFCPRKGCGYYQGVKPHDFQYPGPAASRVSEMASETICEYCGPECLGGAAHNARAEDGAKFDPAKRETEGKLRSADDYRELWSVVMTQVAMLAMLPIQESLKGLERADTFAPILDPTLYRNYLYSGKGEIIKDVLRGALQFTAAIKRAQAQVEANPRLMRD